MKKNLILLLLTFYFFDIKVGIDGSFLLKISSIACIGICGYLIAKDSKDYGLIVSSDQKDQVKKSREFFEQLYKSLNNKTQYEIFTEIYKNILNDFDESDVKNNEKIIILFQERLYNKLPLVLIEKDAVKNDDFKIKDSDLKSIKENYNKIINLLNKNDFLVVTIKALQTSEIIKLQDNLIAVVDKVAPNSLYPYFDTIENLYSRLTEFYNFECKYQKELNEFQVLNFKNNNLIDELKSLIEKLKKTDQYKIEILKQRDDMILKNELKLYQVKAKIALDEKIAAEAAYQKSKFDAEAAALNLQKIAAEEANNLHLAKIEESKKLEYIFQISFNKILSNYFINKDIALASQAISDLFKENIKSGMNINNLLNLWTNNFNAKLFEALNKELKMLNDKEKELENIKNENIKLQENIVQLRKENSNQYLEIKNLNKKISQYIVDIKNLENDVKLSKIKINDLEKNNELCMQAWQDIIKNNLNFFVENNSNLDDIEKVKFLEIIANFKIDLNVKAA